MSRTLVVTAALLAMLCTGAAWGQQPSQMLITSGQGVLAETKCHGQSYVSVTADSEQAMPFKLVATLKCGEEIRILSDPQGYTVKVRTANGTVGYVTRYEVAIVPQPVQLIAAGNASASTSPVPSQSGTNSGAGSSSQAQGNDSSKPRVYVSDTQSWTDSGGFSRSSSVAEGKLYGGYDPEMADIYQGFTSDCPAVVVTQEKSKANYAVLFDKGVSKKGITGMGGLVKVNKVIVLLPDGETVFSQWAHSADTVVKLTCQAITQRSISATTAQTHP